jgi:hypothetical protein
MRALKKEKIMRKLAMLVVAAAVVSMAAQWSPAADEKPGQQVTVLENFSVWRTFNLLKPPVIQFDDGLKPVLSPLADWCNRETPAAPALWLKPEFDDSTWGRGTALTFSRTPYLARLYERAHFEVTDPAQVNNLRLSLSYYGGAIVYVNGQEVARGQVANAGAGDVAEGYPPAAFTGGNVAVLVPQKERDRALTDIAIPASMLRKGVNVLALEIVRAPYNKVVADQKDVPGVSKKDIVDRGCPYDLLWNTCELRTVKLTAASADGLVPNAAGRPKEMQAWNGDILATDFDTDIGDRYEPLRPVALKGARNGWFSGKVVVGSPKAIEGLTAVVADLQQGAATIPAAAVRVRYEIAADEGYDSTVTVPYGSRRQDGGLLEAPLETFTAAVANHGTVVPIWLTVKVPADAQPGTYTGQMTISAKGERTVTVPVKLEVADFTLPNPDDYRTWVELIQSPDTLALEYGVPLWSDQHWVLIEKSLRFIGEMGSRTVYIPLISHTNFGNAESMVRWIKKPDGTCDWDFSAMDKYLDLVEKNMGKPKIVAFNVWEVYLNAPPKETKVTADPNDTWLRVHQEAEAAKWALRGKGPAVTALDPASGKIETVNLPRFEDPASKALWKPLFDELHKRMAKRGLEDKMMLGMASDNWPTKEEVATLQEVSGNLPWVSHTHGGSRIRGMYNIGPFKYLAFVWDNVLAPEPSKGRMYGWKRPDLATQYLRFNTLNDWSLPSVLHAEELNITGQQRGLGRIGADFWPAIKDKKGQRRGYAVDRYPESFWHSLNLTSHMLAPGPNGPVAMARFEILREGLQECEARIAIERVLTDETLKAKLPAELAQKSQDVLDERLREMWRCGSRLALTGAVPCYATWPLGHADAYGQWAEAGNRWFLSSGWQDRTQQFYALAGEVEKKVPAK